MQSETPPCPEPQRSEQEWTEVAKALRTHAKELFSTRTNASTFRNNLLRAADLLDAHNAALALAWKEHDEHEEGRKAERAVWEAAVKSGRLPELAAERQRREQAEKALESYTKSVNNADRHNAKWQERAERAEQQLLSTQAVIAWVLDHDGLYGPVGWAAVRVKLREVGLSLLREHEAKVCQPLVDALEAQAKLTAYYNGKSDGHWRNYLCPKAVKALTDFNARKSEGVKTK